MINISVIDTFLQNFNYLDAKTKKRAVSNSFFNFFFNLGKNDKLTAALEDIANNLKSNLEDVDNSKKKPDQKFTEFKTIMNKAWEDVKQQRDDHAPTITLTTTHPISAVSPIDFSLYGPHHVTYKDYHKPYGPGKFEEQLIAGLRAACNKLPDGVEKDYCRDLANTIATFKPEPKPSIEHEYSTGSVNRPC